MVSIKDKFTFLDGQIGVNDVFIVHMGEKNLYLKEVFKTANTFLFSKLSGLESEGSFLYVRM